MLEAVKTSVNPKVIDCPAPSAGKTTIDAVAKDGIVIKAKARVTVRTNLDRFVGGATEETIIARVGEGIVSTIGSSAAYKEVLENPDRISKTVLDKALDSNTAFEILSIDIADVDVGENVGAKLQAEQAEANKLIAQAQAEVRRAAAVATEQEMVARVSEMRARVVEAEAQIPICHRPAPSTRATWASWIITASRTCRRTRPCAKTSASEGPEASSLRRAGGEEVDSGSGAHECAVRRRTFRQPVACRDLSSSSARSPTG